MKELHYSLRICKDHYILIISLSPLLYPNPVWKNWISIAQIHKIPAFLDLKNL